MESVLIIERSEHDARHLQQFVVQAGFECMPVSNGCVAESPDNRKCSLILTSGSPVAADFGPFVRSLGERFPRVPVVMVTGPNGISTRDALQSGVTGCVPHCSLASDLAWTLQTILVSGPLAGSGVDTRGGVAEAICHTIDNSPELLPLVIDQIRQRLERWPFPDPMEVVRVMVALSESLDNALYHGNLELNSELRQGDGRAWRDECQRRQSTAPYCDRKIRLQAVFGDQSAEFIIRDEGPGFDPLSQVDCTQSQHKERCSGRGLLLMRMYMDDVRFNPVGNQVTLVKHHPRAAGP